MAKNENTAQAQPEADPVAEAPVAKVDTIEDLPPRQFFDTLDLCGPVLASYQKVAHEGIEFVVIGHDAATGETDTGLYDPATMRTMLFRLTRNQSVKVEGEEKPVTKKMTVAVIVSPVPRVDALTAREDGQSYLEHLFETEAQHRAARPFRECKSNFASVAAEAPHTIEQYIEGTKKDSGGGLLASYNEFFSSCNGQFKKKIDAYNRAKITKADLRDALSCTGFATHRYTHLESVGLFVQMLNYFVKWAEKNEINPTLAQNWLASRDAANFVIPSSDTVANEMDALLDAFGDVDAEVEAKQSGADSAT